MKEANFGELLPALIKSNVKFIVVGGGAAVAHGRASGRPKDLEVIAELQTLPEERGFAQKVVEVDIPRLFKAGWLRHKQKWPRSLAAQTGRLVTSNKIRCASRFVDNRPARAF